MRKHFILALSSVAIISAPAMAQEIQSPPTEYKTQKQERKIDASGTEVNRSHEYSVDQHGAKTKSSTETKTPDGGSAKSEQEHTMTPDGESSTSTETTTAPR